MSVGRRERERERSVRWFVVVLVGTREYGVLGFGGGGRTGGRAPG